MVINSLFSMIHVPEGTEYSLRIETYFVDRDRKRVPDDDHSLDVYDSGDIILETERFIYRFVNVLDAYEVGATLIEHLAAGEERVDLNEMMGCREFDDLFWGDLVVTEKKGGIP